ncbi:MAG: T9SS type A sorting domain-containing protein [Bacteroidetes bacterium]|nr:T9SS type A sorting domain-containing protein [Bacteroidota bacterium]
MIKKLFFISALSFLLPFLTTGQTIFWSEDFTSGGAGWTLNLNGPGVNDSLANEWIINSDYSACTQCGTSGGNLLHITCSSLDATFCPLFGGPSCVYNAGGTDPILTDKFTSSPDISTVGYSNITLKFWYQSFGQSGGDYGKVRLSNDGGSTWTDLVTDYAGNAFCIQASIAIPAIYENIPNFRFAFRWVNNDNSNGNDPPFSIDDIELIADSGSCNLVISASSTASSCMTSNGTATVTAAGGPPPYACSWSDGQTTSTATGLSPGTYTVTVTDSIGCTATATITVNQTGGPSVSATSTSDYCGMGNGTATANASGGAMPYTFNWSDGQSGSGGTSHTATGLLPGTYSVTVTDNNGCSSTTTTSVNATGPLDYTSSTPEECSLNNGTASIYFSSGNPPYTYIWSNGQTGSTATGLAAGMYYVTATDNIGCIAASYVIVDSIKEPAISISSTDASCGAADGTATATVTGGTPPYTYSWSDGETTSSVTGLTAGIYSVTVTDAIGGQIPFWYEDFSSGGLNWTLNIPGTGNNDFYSNEWIINSDYSFCTQCGASGGNLLHITCSSLDATFCPLFGGPSCVYNQGGIDPVQTDKYVSSQDISTVGKSGITLSFRYRSGGEATNDYGIVRLSNDGGTTWTDLPDMYSGQSSCTNASIAIPASYENITNFRIAFRWINNDNATGTDPPFAIDDITLSDSTASACTAVATIVISDSAGAQPVPICLATVDSLSQNNLIVWDKTTFTDADTFFIYRDTANNDYGLIGWVPYNSLSWFTDSARAIYAANGNPNVSSWRYKIAVLDTCGNLGSAGPYHQTIYVTGIGGNFIWNHYAIEGQVQPVPSLLNYLFQRDDYSTGNFVAIQTLSASSTAYTDPDYATYQNTATWRVLTVWNISCNPTAKNSSAGSVINTSISNHFKSPTGFDETGAESSITIYPNPGMDRFVIELNNKTNSKTGKVKIYNMIGQPVYENTLNEKRTGIFIRLPQGVYELRIETNSLLIHEKIIIE